MSLLMDLCMYTAAISAVLLLILVVVYLRVYKETHAQFSLGLSVFASILFAQNILAVFSFVTMSSYIQQPFQPDLLGSNVAEARAIIALLRTTTR